MSDGVMIALITFLASLISVGVTALITYTVNKSKVPAEVEQITADADLSRAELAEKWQGLADKATSKTIALEQQLDEEGATHQATEAELMKEIEKLRSQIDQLRSDFELEKEEHRKELEEERSKREIAEDHKMRLIAQLVSWRIQPVPEDIETAKLDIKKSCIDGAEIVTK